jgi:acetyl esterase/lipase
MAYECGVIIPLLKAARNAGCGLLCVLLAAAAPSAAADHAYGSDPLQTLDFWPAPGAKPAPLILFVHGGGWKRGDKDTATGERKIGHLTGQGYAFASIDYRLVPAATVEQQAADVASAAAWLRANAERLKIDPASIVLMGHSAGAQLVALVGTDPRYLAAAGLSPKDIRGVVALDGASYDVPRQIAQAGPLMRRTYLQAFGEEPARQRTLSPALRPIAPEGPAFLVLHVDRADGKAQSEELAESLARAGRPVELQGFGGTGLRGHMEINRSLGSPDYPATAIVDAWLNKLIYSPSPR